MPRSAEIARRAAARAWSQPDTLGDADCEELHGGLVGQPVNTASSFAYVGVGVWLLTRTRRLPRGGRAAARWYAGLVALTGAGSIAYHGPQFEGAQLFHDLPVVGVFGLGVGVPVARRLRGRPVLGPGTVPRAWGAAALGAVAGLAYLGGRTSSPVCDPDSLVQFHGLWHLCTAGAAGLWATALWPLAASGQPAPTGAVPLEGPVQGPRSR